MCKIYRQHWLFIAQGPVTTCAV